MPPGAYILAFDISPPVDPEGALGPALNPESYHSASKHSSHEPKKEEPGARGLPIFQIKQLALSVFALASEWLTKDLRKVRVTAHGKRNSR